MRTPGTSPDANASAGDDALVRYRAQYEREYDVLGSLLSRPGFARTLSDIDDPLEGCDSLCRSITYGRVGDPAGTHTRAQMKRATVRAFGYQPGYVHVHSEVWRREDGEDEGREIDE